MGRRFVLFNKWTGIFYTSELTYIYSINIKLTSYTIIEKTRTKNIRLTALPLQINFMSSYQEYSCGLLI